MAEKKAPAKKTAARNAAKKAPAKAKKATVKRQLLSVVVPCFNEHEVLPIFHDKLSEVLASVDMEAEIIYVNDGSRDSTLAIMQLLQDRDDRVVIVNLSRNFGKEIALTAGLDHASGDAVIITDADMQDPPELIPDLIAPWRDEGCDVVYAQRQSRLGDSFMKRLTAHGFYEVINWVSRVEIPKNTGDFRLMSRRALDALLRLREHHRFMKGLFAWIGYKQKAVPFHRKPRAAGRTKWNYINLWNLSLEGITGFTIAPLKAATYIGLAVAASAAFYGVMVIYDTLKNGAPPGYPSLITVVLFMGGLQLMTLGILGEYVGRIFNETKGRPLYLVQDVFRKDEKAGTKPASAKKSG